MAVMAAKDFMMYIDDGAGGALVALLCSNDASINITTDEDVIECKGDDFKQRMMGLHDWNGSSSGFSIVDSGVTPKTLFNLQKDRTEVKVKFSTEVTADFYFEGPCYISSLDLSGGTTGGVAYTVNIVGTGDLEVKDVPA